MASSLHFCSLPPPPMLGFRSPRPSPPSRLAIRLSAFLTTQACFAHYPSHVGAWRPGCRRPECMAAASGDEAPAAGAGSLQDLEDSPFDITRLEQYTEKVKNEVLRVHAVVDGEEDQVIIFKVVNGSYIVHERIQFGHPAIVEAQAFKGFSSSLMRPTAYDPAEPVLPPSATIRAIDRIRGPFNPAKVLLIKGGKGLSWQQFQTLLEEKEL